MFSALARASITASSGLLQRSCSPLRWRALWRSHSCLAASQGYRHPGWPPLHRRRPPSRRLRRPPGNGRHGPAHAAPSRSPQRHRRGNGRRRGDVRRLPVLRTPLLPRRRSRSARRPPPSPSRPPPRPSNPSPSPSRPYLCRSSRRRSCRPSHPRRHRRRCRCLPACPAGRPRISPCSSRASCRRRRRRRRLPATSRRSYARRP